MRIIRLAVEARGQTINVAFHEHLTVVTGVGSATRESIIQELLGGLGSHRSGTHIEVITDDGRRLTIFRPSDAPHRIVDTASGADVSDEFTTPDGTVDLLAHFGLDLVTARRWSRIGPNDLVASAQSQQLIARLGRIDQRALWSDAQRVQIAKQALEDHAPETAPEDLSLTQRIDKNYHAHDAALAQADRTRLLALVVGTVSLAAAGIAYTVSKPTALAMLAVAIVATVTAFIFRARVAYFDRQLKSALGESGSDSYLGYQLDRIDGYISSEHHRRHRAAVQADLDDALERWHRTAGDVTVDWAVEHRPEIEAAASFASGRSPESGTSEDLVARGLPSDKQELVKSLLGRVAKARHLGVDGESFPLLLDEPFGALEPDMRPALLSTLLGHQDAPQVIILTNSDDIVAWARVEELTGALALVGPGEGAGRSSDATSPGSGSNDLP